MIDHLQFGKADVLEGFTTLSYMAARHPQLKFGHTLLCQPFRNPALLAKMGATAIALFQRLDNRQGLVSCLGSLSTCGVGVATDVMFPAAVNLADCMQWTKRAIQLARDIGWLPVATRMLWFHVAGEMEVTVSDGETRVFPAGTVVLAEDTTGKGHRARVVSEGDVLLVGVELPK